MIGDITSEIIKKKTPINKETRNETIWLLLMLLAKIPIPINNKCLIKK